MRTYCIAKGIAVALNPIPVADLFAAAFDRCRHGRAPVEGLRPADSAVTGGGLARPVIVAEAAALMGTVWALHFVSSALKVGTGGLSTS